MFDTKLKWKDVNGHQKSWCLLQPFSLLAERGSWEVLLFFPEGSQTLDSGYNQMTLETNKQLAEEALRNYLNGWSTALQWAK